MLKIKSHFFDILAIGAITFIIVLIFVANYSGNFWLSGWDNLHPEFNFGVNLERALFSSWQEYQGLGLPAGNGHATELFREIFLWFLNIFVPAIAIRKLYMILMLWSGVVGVYFLIRNFLLKQVAYDSRVVVSFLAALFYLFNLATLQIFFVPYEPFIAYFGLLPWMIYLLYAFFTTGSKRSLLFFLLINLLGSWQFYTPTLFIVYALVVGGIGLGMIFENKMPLKRFFIAILGIVIMNLYWLLPFAYYTLNNINSQQQATVNLLYSQDIYLFNSEYGLLQDATLLKSFLFGFVQFTPTGSYEYMLGPWLAHVNQWYILFIGYGLFSIILFGLVLTLRQKKYIHLGILFLLFFGLLANQVFPFSLINNLFRTTDLFDQIFRNPFTKFGNITLLFMTMFFALGMMFLLARIKKYKKQFYLFIIGIGLFCFSVYMLPMWQGYFLYAPQRVQIPNEYFQLFDYFKQQKNGRIANLPQSSVNGWHFYQWGYQGSGFPWYGIKQPILDRAFDVWNKDNENYYWEVSNAIYSENLPLFESVLEKYQVSWLLFDKNIISASSTKSLFHDELTAMLQKSRKVHLAKQFGNIFVYDVDLVSRPENFVYLTEELPHVSPVYDLNGYDLGHLEYGNYKNVENNPQNTLQIFYPFRSLFTARVHNGLTFDLKEEADRFIFSQKIPRDFTNAEFIVPTPKTEEISEINPLDLKPTLKQPTATITGDTLEVIVPKIRGYFSNETIVSSRVAELTPNNCNKYNQGDLSVTPTTQDGMLVHLESLHANNCVDFNLRNLSQRFSYLLSVKSKNIEGRSLFMTVINDIAKRDEMAVYLPKEKTANTAHYILPPRQQYGISYSIHIDNISFANSKTINDLGEITVHQIPYNYLSEIKLVKNSDKWSSESAFLAGNTPSVVAVNPSKYFVTVDPSQSSQYLVLAQSYNAGWQAYEVDNSPLAKLLPFVFGKKLSEHVLINNWENGWNISELQKRALPVTVALVFWPQWLQHLGLILLAIPFVIILFQRKKIGSLSMNILPLFFRRNFLLIIVFSAIYLLLAHVIIHLKLTQDDFVYIFPAVLKSFVAHFIQYNYDYGLFRPFALIFYYANYSLYLFSPALAHLLPFTLHFAAGIFLFFILRKQKISSNYSLMLSLLYIAFPFTTEAYMWLAASQAVIICFILFLQILIILYGSTKKRVILAVLCLQLASIFFYEVSVLFFIPLAFLISEKFGEGNKLAKRNIFLTTSLILFIPGVIYAITKVIFKAHVAVRTISISPSDLFHNGKIFISNTASLFSNTAFTAEFWVQNSKLGIEIIKSNYVDILLFLFIIFSVGIYFIKNFKQHEYYHSQNIIFWLLLFVTSVLPLIFVKDINFPFRVLSLPLILFIILIVTLTVRLNVLVRFLVVWLLLVIVVVFTLTDLGIAQRYERQFAIDQKITAGIKQTLTDLGFTDTYPTNVLLLKHNRSDVYKSNGYAEHIVSCYVAYWCGEAALSMITGRVIRLGVQFNDGSLFSAGGLHASYGEFMSQRPLVILEQGEEGSLKVIEILQ